MEQNIILKKFIEVAAQNNAHTKTQNDLDKIFADISPFKLYNILGKNQLLAFALVLLILYAWFIRANISLGAILGLMVLGFIYYLYYRYVYYGVRDFTLDKQNKVQLLSEILADTNYYPEEGTLPTSENYFNLDNSTEKNFLYFNPSIVDFYYANKAFLSFAYVNFAKSLQYANAMIQLENQILLGIDNRGNQLTELEFLRQQCLNYWQAIIQSMPSAKANYLKYNNSLTTLTELTQKIIDNAELKVQQLNLQQGINMDYYPIYKSGPKPNDVGTYGFNASFDFFT